MTLFADNEHQANYARLVVLARAEHEQHLAPRAESIQQLRQALSAATAALTVTPWPRRWWGYFRACPRSPYKRIALPCLLTAVVIITMRNTLAIKLIAVFLLLTLLLAMPYIGYDELKSSIRQMKRQLREADASEATVAASYLLGRLTPDRLPSFDTGGDAPYDWRTRSHFAFQYSLEAAKQAIWAPYQLVLKTAAERGYGPEISLAIYATRLFAENQERLAKRIGLMSSQLLAVGQWAWQDGRLDYRKPANARHLAVALEVLDLHARLNRLWRFNEEGDHPTDIQETLRTKEWSAIAARVAELHEAISAKTSP
jgi:hypothetical protein